MVDLLDLDPLLLSEVGETKSQSPRKVTIRKAAIGVAVCIAASLLTVGVSAYHASGGGHVIDMVANQTNTTERVVPVPAHGLARVARLVTDPQAMFDNYGIVSMPILYLNFKGFANFVIQMVLFLGGSIWLGKSAMQIKANSVIRFSKVSIGFQVFGQIGVILGMKSVVMATKPWQGTEQFLTCCLLTSQHASTITAMTGLANNCVIASNLKPTKSIAHNEHGWATFLAVSAAVTSFPIWVSMIVALPFTMVGLGGGFFFLLATDGDRLRKDWKARNAKELLALLLVAVAMGLAILHVFWLVMAIREEHMWLMITAFVLEFMLPLMVLFFLLALAWGEADGQADGGEADEKAWGGMFVAFSISMSISYMITTCVPAAILFYTSDIGFTEAAPTAFWGKKIAVYGENTFVVPGEHAEDFMQLWWSQVIGFFS